jgi:LacI family transcriptional regulator
MAKRTRLIDIAERLNLTKVSVSKALRDHPDISKDTRALVKKTAAEMNYTPNLVARSLSSQRSLTIGAVVPKIAHTFFSSVIDAVQEAATKQGYGLVLAVSNENAVLEQQHIERLLAMRVDGLLVSVSKQKPNLEVYQRVQDMHVPLVFFDRQIEGLGFSSVTVDDRDGAFRAVDHLIKQGHRKIAHIAGTHAVEIGRERRAGYEDALRKHDIALYEPWIIEGGFDEQHGYDAFMQILRSDNLPSAVFASTYPIGLGVYAAMGEYNPDLLNTIQILSFGEGGLNELYTYPHICMRQPTRQMGEQAVQILLDEIEDKASQPAQHIVLKTDLVTSRHHLLPSEGKVEAVQEEA